MKFNKVIAEWNVGYDASNSKKSSSIFSMDGCCVAIFINKEWNKNPAFSELSKSPEEKISCLSASIVVVLEFDKIWFILLLFPNTFWEKLISSMNLKVFKNWFSLSLKSLVSQIFVWVLSKISRRQWFDSNSNHLSINASIHISKIEFIQF